MDGIRHGSDVPESVGFWTGLFFSVQSSETIGFGYLSPAGSGTNIVVVIEAYYAQMSYAVLTGVRSTLLIVGVGVVVALPVISALCTCAVCHYLLPCMPLHRSLTFSSRPRRWG